MCGSVRVDARRGNTNAASDGSEQLVLFIANSTRLVDMAECD